MAKSKSLSDLASLVPSLAPSGDDTVQPEAIIPPRPKLPPLWVGKSVKGRGGKTATLITGHTGSDDEIESLCKTLKTSLGIGGAARGGEILLQGEVVDKVTKWLEAKGHKVTRST